MGVISHFRHRGKLRLIVPSIIALLAFICTLFFFFLPRVRDAGIEQKKDSIRELVRLPIQICDWFNKNVEQGELDDATARRQAADMIEGLRYGVENKDYFWITDTAPVLIMHPYRDDLEGTNVENYEDLDGVRVFMEMVRIVQAYGEGYVSYHWQVRDETDEIERKLSYVFLYEPWNWIIGTGMYLGEVEAEIASLSRSMIYVSIGVVLIVSLLLFLMIRTGLSEQSAKIQARAELAESRDRYMKLITMMHEGIIVRSSEGLISFVNRQFCEMLGYEEDELLGKPVVDFIAEESVPSFLREMERRKSGEEPSYQTDWKKRGGGTITTLMSPRVLYGTDGRQEGSFAVVSDITELKNAEKELRSLLREKTTLLKEVHHRVKNNLQLITSLFSLQNQYVEDERVRNLLFDSQSRIQTMSRIHEFLYQSNNLQDIEMKEFLEQLVSDTSALYPEIEKKNISFELLSEAVELPVDRAIPCGLIMNELVSNAVKHAFPAGYETNTGRMVVLFLEQTDDSILFGVEDNGMGFPEKADEAGASLGMELITILTEQLRGKIEFSPGGSGRGCRVEISIPSPRQEMSVLYAV